MSDHDQSSLSQKRSLWAPSDAPLMSDLAFYTLIFYTLKFFGMD